MKLVDDWRKAWRFISIQMALVGGSMQGAVIAFPDFKDWLGEKLSHWVGVLMFAGIILGRVVKQKPKGEE